jgi:nucleoside 2-deoxyribosyltransferase
MSEGIVICPVCKYNQGVKENKLKPSVDAGKVPTPPMVSYQCPVCGSYEIPPRAAGIRDEPTPNRKFSAWIREQNEQGLEVRFPSESTITNVLNSLPDYRPSEKQLKLLKAIERRSDPPGTTVVLSAGRDIPLAYSSSSTELAFHIQALKERGFLSSPTAWKAKITPAGWDYLDKHASDLKAKTQAFVAMSFSDEMKAIWEDAIKPAISEAGYTPYRVDEDLHSENIIFKIMAEIKDSRFVVADLTEQNNGVYFEAGYGLGLGLPVIWTIRKDDVENVHFDTAQYNQIRWESAEELKDALSNYISAIIGKRNQAQR